MMIALILATACVGKGSYELVEVQLDATRTALTTTNAAYYEDVRERETQIVGLEEELRTLRAQHEDLRTRLSETTTTMETSRAELAQLLTEPNGPNAQSILEESTEEVEHALNYVANSEQKKAQIESIKADIRAAFETLEEEDRLEVLETGPHVNIRIPIKQIFNEGRVSVSPRGEVLLGRIAEVFSEMPRVHVMVTAHTDDRPYHSAQHLSSWELGFAQAMTFIRTLEQADVNQEMSAASAAGTLPIADNGTEEGRDENRRLELTILPANPPHVDETEDGDEEETTETAEDSEE